MLPCRLEACLSLAASACWIGSCLGRNIVALAIAPRLTMLGGSLVHVHRRSLDLDPLMFPLQGGVGDGLARRVCRVDLEIGQPGLNVCDHLLRNFPRKKVRRIGVLLKLPLLQLLGCFSAGASHDVAIAFSG